MIFMLNVSHSANYEWPNGDNECSIDHSLNHCINSMTQNGDVLYINTNKPINESLTINKSISLKAGNGFNPTFTNGSYLIFEINDTIEIHGLTLEKGFIKINFNNSQNNNTQTKITISNNTILDTFTGLSALNINHSNSQDKNLKLIIANNKFEIKNNHNEFFKKSIFIENNSLGNITGSIIFNYMHASSLHPIGSKGIMIINHIHSKGYIDLNVLNNIMHNYETNVQVFHTSFAPKKINVEIKNNSFTADS